MNNTSPETNLSVEELMQVNLSIDEAYLLDGYARTSTTEQQAGFDAQLRELQIVDCTKIFQEQISSQGTRVQLSAAIEFAREGDVFIVTKLDRFARSMRDLIVIIDTLAMKQFTVRIINLGLDT